MATGSEPRADLAHDATRQAPAAAAPADRAEGGGPAGVPPPGRQPADALSLLDQIIEKSPIGIAVIVQVSARR